MITNNELITISSLLDTKFDAVFAQMNIKEERFEDKIESKISKVENSINQLKGEIQKIQSDVQELKLLMENNIIVLTNEIKSAYPDAARRYLKSSEDIESMKMDIRLLKDFAKQQMAER